MLTYTELKAFVCKSNVKSRNDYKQLYATQALPKGAPENPEKEYAEFEGWRAFLGKKVDVSKILSYVNAKILLKKKYPEIKTVLAYRAAFSQGLLEDALPKDPPRHYKKEWQSWTDFLSSSNRKGSFVSYETARAFYSNLNLANPTEFHEYIATHKLPDAMPKSPAFVYKDVFIKRGGWRYFLGNEFMPFDEAQDYIRKQGITSFEAYRAWASSDQRPKNFPSTPHSFKGYEDYWISYPSFLGMTTVKREKQYSNDKETALKVIKKLLKEFPDLKSELKSDLK